MLHESKIMVTSVKVVENPVWLTDSIVQAAYVSKR